MAKLPVKASMRAKKTIAPDAPGRAISQAHHLDSVVYNEAHAFRHIQEAEKHAAKLEPAARKQPAVKAELKKVTALKLRLQAKKLNGTAKSNGDRQSG